MALGLMGVPVDILLTAVDNKDNVVKLQAAEQVKCELYLG
jgi:hypothetical protein